jgi:hypothetical protein
MQMRKVHVLYRRSYSDFDIPQDVPQAVSEHKVTLDDKAISLNARLTDREKHQEVRFHVSHDTIPWIV